MDDNAARESARRAFQKCRDQSTRLFASDTALQMQLEQHLSEIEDLIDRCTMYSQPRHQMAAAEVEELQLIIERARAAHVELLQNNPDFVGTREQERVLELARELDRLSQRDFSSSTFLERKTAVDEIDLRLVEYRLDLERPAHSFGKSLDLFLARIAALKKIRTQIIDVDSSHFQNLFSGRQSGSLSIGDIARELLLELDSAEAGHTRIGTADYYLNHLLGVFDTPAHVREFTNDMRHYYPTPAGLFARLIMKRLKLSESDVFYDFGSGMGRLPIMVRLLTPATAKGIEFEPRYNDIGLDLVRKLRLDKIDLITADAREVDFNDGTVFYFFEPFRGQIMDSITERIAEISRKRTVTIVSNGHTECTRKITELDFTDQGEEEDSVFVFKTL